MVTHAVVTKNRMYQEENLWEGGKKRREIKKCQKTNGKHKRQKLNGIRSHTSTDFYTSMTFLY